MYYANRIELGQKLAARIEELKGTEPVILCLHEEALTTCVSLAAQIHAWIFPLLTEKIKLPGDPRVMGVINPDGIFSWDPNIPKMEQDGIISEFHSVIEDAKREAFSKLNLRLTEWGPLNKSALQGRTILVSGDIVNDRIEIVAAMEFIKEINAQQVMGIAGNIDSSAADELHIKADKTEFLDVMTHMFDEEHYFEQSDAYSLSESRQLAMNITHYWI